MTWKPIDFQGIVTLDRPLVEQLSRFLDEKESQLGWTINKSIPPIPGESIAPVLSPSPQATLKLSESIEAFGKKVRQISRNSKTLFSKDDWQKTVRIINAALWDYVEALEGTVTELFQQVEQVGFEQWHDELSKVVENIKELVLHHMEDLAWAIRRLESQLREFRWTCQRSRKTSRFFNQVFLGWKPLLDKALLSNLKKSQKFLCFRYNNFVDRYGGYMSLKDKVDQSLQKFKGYNTFSALDSDTQEKFKKIYKLLKLWELNHNSKLLPERDPVRLLRNIISSEKAFPIFREYYQTLRRALFEKSRNFKKSPQEFFLHTQGKGMMEESIAITRAELHTLGATIAKYREFLLRTDPNPYIRTRWGFAEWITGPEPAQTKQLLNLGYEVEEIDSLFVSIRKALDKGPAPQDGLRIGQLNKEIGAVIHEMGQPLTSRSLMRIRAERLLNLLQQLDELGSFSPLAVDYVGMILGKALRADWKYHVLHEISDFHKIYSIHQGIVGPIEDRHHLNRVHRFKRLTNQIEQWVKNNDTQRHAHEIELDMNDMKGYLQDFLAYVQRISKDSSMDLGKANQVINDISQELLEYRYLFGNFFNHLRYNDPEEKMIRNQFLFVDQYFESIENKIHDLRHTKWQPKT